MAIETATYVGQLNILLPTGSDYVSEGDDHIRLIKSTLTNTFPNLIAQVLRTADELNSVTERVLRSGDAMTGALSLPRAVVKAPDATTAPEIEFQDETGGRHGHVIWNRSGSGMIELWNWDNASVFTSLAVGGGAAYVQGQPLAFSSLSNVAAVDVLNKLKTVDGPGSGLDADTLDGLQPDTTATANTVAARDATGALAASDITASGTVSAGNVATAGGVSAGSVSAGSVSAGDVTADTIDANIALRSGGQDVAHVSLDNVANSTFLQKIQAVDGPGSGVDADTLDGAQSAETATGGTIAQRKANGALVQAVAEIGPDSSGHGRAYLFNASGGQAELIKRNDNGAVELRCIDAQGTLRAEMVAAEDGGLVWQNAGIPITSYLPTVDRLQDYKSRYISGPHGNLPYLRPDNVSTWSGKRIYVNQTTGNDATARIDDPNYPAKTIAGAAMLLPRGATVNVVLQSDYVVNADENIFGVHLGIDVNGFRLSGQWHSRVAGTTTYAALYNIYLYNSRLTISIDNRGGNNGQIVIPARDATLSGLPLFPTRDRLFYPRAATDSSIIISCRTDSTSVVAPLEIREGSLIGQYPWGHERSPSLDVTLGVHYANGKNPIFGGGAAPAYLVSYSSGNGSVYIGSDLPPVDGAGNPLKWADVVTGRSSPSARNIQFYSRDGSHVASTKGELGEVVVFDKAGSYTWTAPANCRGIFLTLVGGGGGGGAAWASSTTLANGVVLRGGQGGESGGLVRVWVPISVLGRDTWTITVGAGGAAGASDFVNPGAGSAGTATRFSNTSASIEAVGGAGGAAGTTNTNARLLYPIAGSISDNITASVDVLQAASPTENGGEVFVSAWSTISADIIIAGGRESAPPIVPASVSTVSTPDKVLAVKGKGGNGGEIILYANDSGIRFGAAGSGTDGFCIIEVYY